MGPPCGQAGAVLLSHIPCLLERFFFSDCDLSKMTNTYSFWQTWKGYQNIMNKIKTTCDSII